MRRVIVINTVGAVMLAGAFISDHVLAICYARGAARRRIALGSGAFGRKALPQLGVQLCRRCGQRPGAVCSTRSAGAEWPCGGVDNRW